MFLDFDGVANSHRSTIALFGRENPQGDEIDPYFDPLAINLLRYFTNAGVLIVVSSTWRLGRTVEELSAILGLPVYSKTESLESGWRADEIRKWLSENPTKHWVVIDDDSHDTKELAPNFVHTNEKEGFLHSNFEQVCSILEMEWLTFTTLGPKNEQSNSNK